MSELNEKRWAVISERGVEISGAIYQEALDVMRRLDKEKVSGLCLVTNQAARRDTRQPSLAGTPSSRAKGTKRLSRKG